MRKKGGYVPDPFEDEDEESEFRKGRRYYRKRVVRVKAKRWRKRQSG